MPREYKGEVIYCAEDIKRALAQKHQQDMFFTEVKDGPTQVVAHHARIDALTMKISWTNPLIVGYEVKVARSDFLRDNKWQAYLPMCNQLYFAVAPGVCDVSEVPESCGLMQITKSGAMRTIRKAPWREIEPPVNMFRYLMYNYIGAYWAQDKNMPRVDRLLPNDRAEVFKRYLDDTAEWREVGRCVSHKLSRELDRLKIIEDRYNCILIEQQAEKRAFNEVCKALGVRSTEWHALEKCLQSIEEMKSNGGITPGMKKAVLDIKNDAEILLREFDTEKGEKK